jgi:HlyD family secretion protein
VKGQARSLEVQKRTDREAKKSVWEQELAHYKDIEAEIVKCKITAPQDGLVVYFIPDQARFGGGSQQSIVAQGEPVREGQKLMQIPDLKHMLVNTKVHEALVSRVHPGQPAAVRVDSAPDRKLRGHVESVSTVAAQQDWLSADVKVYTVKVAIDPDDIEGLNLKPGMSAEVTIAVGDTIDHALTVPVEAVVGGSELGSERKVVVMTPGGPQERSVRVGASNETKVEVKDGLAEGDQVVLNPKAVLGDKAKLHQAGAEKGAAPGTGPWGGNQQGKGAPGGNGRGGPGRGGAEEQPAPGGNPADKGGGRGGPPPGRGAGAPGGGQPPAGSGGGK